MKKKNSLIKSIQLNLWGTVVVVLLFTTLTGYVSWDGIKKLESITRNEETLRTFHTFETNIHILRVNELLYFLNMSDASKRNFVLGDWSSTQNQIEDLIKKINAYYLKSLNENERREFSEIEQYIKAYAQAFREIVEKNQKESDSRLVFADIDFAHQQLNEAILLVQQTIENKIAQSKTNADSLEKELLFNAIFFIVLGFIMVVILIISAIHIPKKLVGSIRWISNILTNVSLGRQQTKIVDEGVTEEFVPVVESAERLRISVNGMLERLVSANNVKDG